MYNLIGQDFINMIRSFYPNAKPASGGSEVVVRCPFCGDSKDLSHAHLYISVPRDVTEISKYDCKLCPANGMVTDDFLRKIGCNDTSILISVAKHNAEVLKLPKYRQLKHFDIYPLRYDYTRNSEYNQSKIQYINNRIGSNFGYAELINLKIALNLWDIVSANRLELTRRQSIVNQLDRYFIGFIYYNNAFLNMRKVIDGKLSKSINKRYVNYKLIEDIDYSKAFYVIPTTIDYMSMERTSIHIAEGPFDILSIYHNLNRCRTNNMVYISCGGKAYKRALEFVLTETGVINYDVHVYPDGDVDDYEFSRLCINNIKLLPSNIYIHRNALYKDYGVAPDRIKDTVTVIGDIYG